MGTGRSTSELKRIRRSVFKRDGFTCRDCGTFFPRPRRWNGEHIEGLTLGHIIPRAQGGNYSVGNCIAQCERDNNELDDRIWVPNWRTVYAV